MHGGDTESIRFSQVHVPTLSMESTRSDLPSPRGTTSRSCLLLLITKHQ